MQLADSGPKETVNERAPETFTLHRFLSTTTLYRIRFCGRNNSSKSFRDDALPQPARNARGPCSRSAGARRASGARASLPRLHVQLPPSVVPDFGGRSGVLAA